MGKGLKHFDLSAVISILPMSLQDIETELAELEELISLQRRKVELLKTKNSVLESQTNESEEDDSTSRDGGREGSGEHKSAESKEVPVNNPLASGNGRGKEAKLEVVSSEESNSPQKKKGFFGRMLSKRSDRLASNGESKEDKFIDSMTRLQRLTTDLANERNLLAWGRTALAASRTCLAFFAVNGHLS